MINDINGILLLNKAPGVTSFGALGEIKKCLKLYSGERVKVGHTGTLDRFAEGLLVVLTGKLTRMNRFFTNFDKTYEAVIEFGRRTDTLDPEGSVIEQEPVPDYSVIIEKIKNFKGAVNQRPPVYSAVHVNGERAYKKALRGEIDQLPGREVIIHSFDILKWDAPFLKCVIHCSKGTYIRSIARDLGEACGSCAYLKELKRLKVGPYRLEDAIDSGNFSPDDHLLTGKAAFSELLENYPNDFKAAEVRDDSLENFKNGKKIENHFFERAPEIDGSYLLFNRERFIASVNLSSGRYSYNFTGNL